MEKNCLIMWRRYIDSETYLGNNLRKESTKKSIREGLTSNSKELELKKRAPIEVSFAFCDVVAIAKFPNNFSAAAIAIAFAAGGAHKGPFKTTPLGYGRGMETFVEGGTKRIRPSSRKKRGVIEVTARSVWGIEGHHVYFLPPLL
jgi:hypothetical protein